MPHNLFSLPVYHKRTELFEGELRGRLKRVARKVTHQAGAKLAGGWPVLEVSRDVKEPCRLRFAQASSPLSQEGAVAQT